MTHQQKSKRRSHTSQAEIDRTFQKLGLGQQGTPGTYGYERPVEPQPYYTIKVSGSADEATACYEAVVHA